MSDLSSFNIENTVQPITDDFSSDGMLDEFSRVDHQHPLSSSLRSLIGGKVANIAALPSAALHANEIYQTLDHKIMFSDGTGWIIIYPETRVGGDWGRASAQPISTGGVTQVLLDSEYTDYNGFLIPTSGVATIPANFSAVYGVTLQVSYVIAALGINFCRLAIGSFGSAPARTFDFYGGTVSGIQSGSLSIPLIAGQTITCQTFHSAGSNQNITAYFSLVKVANY